MRRFFCPQNVLDPRLGAALRQAQGDAFMLSQLLHRGDRDPLAVVYDGVTAFQYRLRVKRLQRCAQALYALALFAQRLCDGALQRLGVLRQLQSGCAQFGFLALQPGLQTLQFQPQLRQVVVL
jgi:hypothetical protein